MSYDIIAGILLAGLALSRVISSRGMRTEVEKDCLENMYYWTVMTLCYVFGSILYICFHAGEIALSGEYRNGIFMLAMVAVLVALIEIASPSGGFGKIARFFRRMARRGGGRRQEWIVKEGEKDGDDVREAGSMEAKRPFYSSYRKFQQKTHYRAEDTYNLFYRFTSLVFTCFLVVLPLIRRAAYRFGETGDDWVRNHLSDAFLSVLGFCLIIMTAICIRQLWYQLRFMRRLPVGNKSYDRMGRSVQANTYMSKRHKIL